MSNVFIVARGVGNMLLDENSESDDISMGWSELLDGQLAVTAHEMRAKLFTDEGLP